MIEAQGLTKRFGAYTAIEDVSFRVERGEIVGFLGPNGAGKSTTMRILAGVFPPSEGVARVAGFDVAREPLRARAAVGYFPERASVYLDMTVRDYLTFVARMKGLRGGDARRALDRPLEACGLQRVADRLIATLSKGFRQRVGIAQALVGAPPVLILDEPTSGLDPEQVVEMRALVRSFEGERTVILSTHILSEVDATCDRVIIINQGRVLAVDSPGNLSDRVRDTIKLHVEIHAPNGAVVSALENLEGIVAVEPGANAAFTVHTRKGPDRREAIAAEVARHSWGLRELRPVPLTLEEIFLTLVQHPSPSSSGASHADPGDL